MAKPKKQARVRTVDGQGADQRLALYTKLWLSAFAVIFGYFIVRYVVLKLSVIPMQTVGPLQFNTFGPLVALGILFGIHLIHRWCLRFDLDWLTMQECIVRVVLTGFVLARLMAIGESSPANLLNPYKLFATRSGFSSFGAFIGSPIAAIYFCKKRAVAVRPYIDCLLYGFVGGWLFGRLGCFSVHDHPGVRTNFPASVLIRGELRHDLGLYELLFTLVLFTYLTYAIRTGKRFDGFIVAATATSYSLVRFLLDFLRAGDLTYASLTLAQWGCIPLCALGVRALLRGRHR